MKSVTKDIVAAPELLNLLTDLSVEVLLKAGGKRIKTAKEKPRSITLRVGTKQGTRRKTPVVSLSNHRRESLGHGMAGIPAAKPLRDHIL